MAPDVEDVDCSAVPLRHVDTRRNGNTVSDRQVGNRPRLRLAASAFDEDRMVARDPDRPPVARRHLVASPERRGREERPRPRPPETPPPSQGGEPEGAEP